MLGSKDWSLMTSCADLGLEWDMLTACASKDACV
jgi:hypothetical protein